VIWYRVHIRDLHREVIFIKTSLIKSFYQSINNETCIVIIIKVAGMIILLLNTIIM
jgi:hypothetical protein